MSRAPICNGMSRFPKPLTGAVDITKKTMGRYLPPGEDERGDRVCVIGAKLQDELFLGQNPLGESLRLGQERFKVIGVMSPRGVSLGTDLDEVVHVPVAQALALFDQRGLSQVMAMMCGV